MDKITNPFENLGDMKNKRLYIYNLKSEKYGIKEFNRQLFEILQTYEFDVRICFYSNFIQLIFCFLRDSWLGNYSLINFRQGFLSFLNYKKCILMLHGFPNLQDYSLVRASVVVLSTKLASISSKYTISNSSLTKNINKKMFNVSSDFIWNPYLLNNTSEIIADKYVPVKMTEGPKPKILYVGRVTKAKGISQTLETLSQLQDLFDEVVFVGPVEKDLDLAVDFNLGLIGAVEPNDVEQYYIASDIFISINFYEPLGITYFEAEKYNLEIILPKFAGARDYLKQSDNIHLVADDSPECMKQALQSAIANYYTKNKDSRCKK